MKIDRLIPDFVRFARSAALVLLCATWVAPSQAQQLDEIVKRGKLIVGIEVGSPPYGSLGKDQKPLGLDVDLANMIAKDMGVQLEIVPTTGANRIPYLLTKRIDIAIAIFTITPERAKSVAFSIPYAAVSEVVAAAKNVKIASMQDLAGKKVAVARGTTMEDDAVALAPSTAQIIRFDDDASAQAAYISGQVDVYMGASSTTKAMLQRRAGLNMEDKLVIRWFYQGIGMRRGDPDFARWIDTTLMIHRESGALTRLHEKWFGAKLPALPSF